MNTAQKDRQYLGRDNPSVPLEICGAKGSFLYDREGREYIDFLVGWNVGNLGWNVEKITDEIKKFNGPNYVNPSFLYEPWAELAEILADITPGNLSKSYRTTGGTESVELALQAAMSHTKRNKFLSIEGSYHGHSIGAMSIGASDFRDHYTNLLPGCFKIEAPLDKKAAEKVD